MRVTKEYCTCDNRIDVCSLGIGDFFIYHDKLCMITNVEFDKSYAYVFCDEKLISFEDINGECMIEQIDTDLIEIKYYVEEE